MREGDMSQRPSQVVEELIELEAAGEELHKGIGLLETCLECVLSVPVPTPEGKDEEKVSGLVSLAQQLARHAAQIRYASRRISDIHRRLEL